MYRKTVRVALCLALLALQTTLSAQTIERSGNRFMVDGQPRFLVFVDYFDAMDVPDAGVFSDFGQLRAWGVDGIRIFPNWYTVQPNTFAGDTVIAPDGSVRDSSFFNMVWYLDRAREYGLLVDLSFSGETVSSCADCTVDFSLNDLTFDAYLNGIREVASRLSGPGYRHVLFDIQNESNLNGPWHRTPLSDGQIAQISDAVHSVDPGRLVTASVDQAYVNDLSGMAVRAMNGRQNFIAWHEPRFDHWWNNTVSWLQQIRSATDMPVHLQEPAKLEDGAWFSGNDLLNAVQQAKQGCAAAWTFHTSASFYMNGSSLLGNISSAGWRQPELDFLNGLQAARDAVGWCVF